MLCNAHVRSIFRLIGARHDGSPVGGGTVHHTAGRRRLCLIAYQAATYSMHSP